MNVLIKKLYDDAILPSKAHPSDACFDVYAYAPSERYYNDKGEHKQGFYVMPHETSFVHTGFSTAIPIGYKANIHARSGLSSKHGIRLANCTGIIDANWRGEWIVALYNDSDEPYVIHHGDRIAQMEIVPVLDTHFIEVDELDDTDRGTGGFGSSGK